MVVVFAKTRHTIQGELLGEECDARRGRDHRSSQCTAANNLVGHHHLLRLAVNANHNIIVGHVTVLAWYGRLKPKADQG